MSSGFFLGTEKKRKVWFDNGKDMVANEKDVWRIAKRLEFERVTTFDNVRPGQTVRVTLTSSARDFFWYCRRNYLDKLQNSTNLGS